MRDYEITIILQPDLEEAARTALIERIEGWLAPGEAEAEQLKPNHWGMRQLAYAIKRFNRGYYLYYEASIEPMRVNEIERNLQYTEDVLRYLFVRKDE